VALVADHRVVDRHRQPFRTLDARMADGDDPRHLRARMRIVAIDACNALKIVRRRMPRHRRTARAMALQTEILACPRLDSPMRIVACRATETVRAADLVRTGNLLIDLHVAVAFVANARRKRLDVGRNHRRRCVFLGVLPAHEIRCRHHLRKR